MGDFSTAVKEAVKVYYVIKSRNSGLYAVAGNYARGAFGTGATLPTARRFDAIIDVIYAFQQRTLFTNSAGGLGEFDIVRIEETAGTASRRLIEDGEKAPAGAKYAIQDGCMFLSISTGWETGVNNASLFNSESAALTALQERALKIKYLSSASARVRRVVEVPATPQITETVLA